MLSRTTPGFLTCFALATCLAGCTCTVYEDDESGGAPGVGVGGGGGTTEPGVCHVSLEPGFGTTSVATLGATLRAAWSEPIDPSSLTDQVQLLRLEDDTLAEIQITIVDDKTIDIVPAGSLSYWSSYGLNIGAGVVTSSGETCLPQSTAFNTLEPLAQPVEARPAAGTAVDFKDEFAFVASNQLPGLQVYDLTDLSAPVLKNTIITPAEPTSIRVFDGRAYIAMGSAGVWIYDIADPNTPSLIGVAGTPGVASDSAPFVVNGIHYLAVADGAFGLRILDVEEPKGDPTVSTYYFGANVVADRVSIDGTRLAVGLEDAGFALFDLSSPGDPLLIAQRASEAVPETFDAARPVSDVLLSGDRLYAAIHSYAIQSYDLQNDSIAFIDSVGAPTGLCATNCADNMDNLALSSSGALFATGLISGALRIPDVGSGQLGTIEVLPIEANARGLGLLSGHAVVATDSGLEIRAEDALATDAPTYSETNGWGIVRGVASNGANIYAASGGRGLLTYDPSLAFLGKDSTVGVGTDFGAFNVYINDNLLFLSDARAGFSLFDLSTPADPAKVAEVTGDFDTVDGVAFAGSTAFVCDGNRALLSYDLSDPSNPIEIGSLYLNDTVGGCHQLALEGTTLYVAGSSALGVVDASVPGALVLLKAVHLPANRSVGGVAVYGNHVFASTVNADWEAGTDATARLLLTFDVSNPVQPVLVRQSDDLGLGGRLVVRGDKLFANGGWNGVLVFDLKSPDNPRLEGIIDVPGNALGLAFTDDTLFVAARGAGVVPIPLGRTQ